MKVKIIAIHVLIGFMVFGLGLAHAKEPKMPRVDQTFSPEKEKKMNQLKNSSVEIVFESVRSPEFFDEEDYLNKAVYTAFSHRSAEAVQFALRHVRSSQIQQDAEGPRNLHIAKKIIQIFPDEALEGLLEVYSTAGPKVRKNVIYAVGEMAGGDPIRALLIGALDDGSYCEDRLPETMGEPLRICDVAYNQLVLRYNVKNVARVIGTIHKIEVRNYHIEKLKALL